MAAVLTCGEGAALSHDTAAALWKIREQRRGPIHISVPSPRDPRRRGLQVHRRLKLRPTTKNGIPITGPSRTIMDLAPALTERQLERAIDEADKLDLVNPEGLQLAAAEEGGVGARIVGKLLGKRTFILTDSELERLFIPIAERARVSAPETQVVLHGHRVDFFFREENLVVETDGLRYHRTPTQQKRDRVRDQGLTAAGLRVLRFTHEQIAREGAYVADVLRRLSSKA